MVTRFFFGLLVLFWSSTLHAQAPFYQGKTIQIIVGTKAGDVYDLYPRLVAEFMPKYLSGALFRTARQTSGSQVRVEQVQLDRQHSELEQLDVHAVRHAL